MAENPNCPHPYSQDGHEQVVQQQPNAHGQVVQKQPNAYETSIPQVVADGWGPIPQVISQNRSNVFRTLSTTNSLLVIQKLETIEALCGVETNNEFIIENDNGEKLFYASEDVDCCTRQCCGPKRPFDINIYDNYENNVITLSRTLACQSCFFPCCLQSLQVFSPPGCLVGTIEQEWSILTPVFTIRNAANECVFIMEGPLCTCCCADFKIMSKDKTIDVGEISKQWSGFLREAFTDADVFGVSFPLCLDPRMKAVFLGACFLIDYMYFEK